VGFYWRRIERDGNIASALWLIAYVTHTSVLTDALGGGGGAACARHGSGRALDTVVVLRANLTAGTTFRGPKVPRLAVAVALLVAPPRRQTAWVGAGDLAAAHLVTLSRAIVVCSTFYTRVVPQSVVLPRLIACHTETGVT